MRKTRIILICILTILTSIFNYVLVLGNTYSDMELHWAKDTVDYLTKYTIVNGYEDYTFRPENNVSKGEIIKLVVARYMDNQTSADETHWAMPYVIFAENNNIIPKGMYTTENLDLLASRKEICYMLIQACRNIAHKPVLEDTDMKLDFTDLNDQNRENINEILACVIRSGEVADFFDK